MLKKCSKCQETRPVAEFHRNRTKPDGLSTECKPCVLNKVRTYSAAHVAERSAYHKEWRVRNRETFRAITSASTKAYPEKNAIRKRFAAAVRAGKIEKPVGCWHCGAPNPEGHHASYDRDMWNVVTWLCRACHRQCHKKAA